MADSGDIVKRITITATGENIDSTTQSTQALGAAVGDLTDKNTAFQSQLDGLGGSIGGLASMLGGGVIAGLAGMLDYVVKANKELSDLSSVADQAGLSLTQLQGADFAGALKGIDTTTMNAGLAQASTLLNDASRNSNSLSKELAANGISIKDSNGQLISQNQLLVIAGNLVANAKNPGDKNAIADMLGYGKALVPVLQEGGTAMAGLGTAAEQAGAVISDSTIEKATEFTTEWTKSSVLWADSLKAAVADVLPYVDDLIMRMSKMGLGGVTDAIAKPGLDAISNTGIPDSGGVKIDANAADNFVDGTKTFLQSPIFDPQTWANFGKVFSDNVKFMSPDQLRDQVPGYAASQITEPSYPSQAAMDAAFKKNPAADSQAALNALQDDQQDADDAKSVVAGKDQKNDAVTRAINTLTKHTLQTQADTQAVGLGDAALASFKATAAETAAVMANGGEETAKQKAAFDALKISAGEAAGALALAKVNNTVSRGSQTALLSPEDVTIANQLKAVYPDVATALSSVQAAGMRTNTALSSVSSSMSGAMVTGFTDILNGSKSVGQGFSQMANTILTAIEQMIVKLLIVGPLMQQLQASFTGSGLSAMIGIGGPSTAGLAGSSYAGPVKPPGFASGTNSAPGGWSIIGENGPELMNLQPGATILPNGSFGGGSGGGGGNNVQVNVVNNASGTKATTSKRSEGGVDIHSIIISAVDQHAAGGGLDKVMKTRYATPMRAKTR